ncbi:MAG: AlpA family phage regulatory protein [Alphaproteobacteria bacterium]|nr:AlpA family phage regulatory protein [Alphaproteobacteria bacterium]MCW5741624.1 AlpA family phage regulatory protein [Alphaproteobacteria bacterium]
MRLVPKKEACWLLGISRATIDRRVGTPGFPQRVKQGIRVYYRSDEIDTYIRSLSVSA